MKKTELQKFFGQLNIGDKIVIINKLYEQFNISALHSICEVYHKDSQGIYRIKYPASVGGGWDRIYTADHNKIWMYINE